MLSDREGTRHVCEIVGHRWIEGYYGLECEQCHEFIPYGCEPWNPEPEDDEIKTCETCGGEFWDGGSSCICLADDEDEPDLDDICDCGRRAIDECTLCGWPMCSMCFECGGGVCDHHLSGEAEWYSKKSN